MKRRVQILVLLFSVFVMVMLSETYDFSHISDMEGILIMVIVFLVPFLIIENYFNEREEKDFAFISVFKNTMSLSKRDCVNRKFCSIVPYYNSYLQYNPEKLTYTGASFGGITMGEVNKEDAYYSTRITSQSGKFNLYVKNLKKEQIRIDKIELTAELADEAKKSPFLRTFLEDNILVLNYKNTESETEQIIKANAVFEAQKIGNEEVAWNITQESIIKRLLNYEDCHKILDWICGIDIT